MATLRTLLGDLEKLDKERNELLEMEQCLRAEITEILQREGLFLDQDGDTSAEFYVPGMGLFTARLTQNKLDYAIAWRSIPMLDPNCNGELEDNSPDRGAILAAIDAMESVGSDGGEVAADVGTSKPLAILNATSFQELLDAGILDCGHVVVVLRDDAMPAVQADQQAPQITEELSS